MKTQTRQKFIKRCEELGVIYANNGYGLAIDSPSGKVFKTYRTHSEFICFSDGWKMGEIYAEFLYIMKDGLDNCDDKDCEICNDIIPLHLSVNNYQYNK